MLSPWIAGVLALNLQTAPSQPVPQPNPPPEPVTQASAPSPQDTGDKTPENGVRFVWRDHPSIRAGRWLRLDFVGKFQWDARRPGDDPRGFDSTEFHRTRVALEGEVFRHIQFSLERELTEREIEPATLVSSRANHAWKDVYLEANYTDMAQVRVGKFKVPFGLDQLTSIMNLDFVYRSLAGSQLAPGRDIGLMAHGEFFNGTLGYSGGVFKQDGENARSKRIKGGDRTGAGRVTVRPLRSIKAANLDRLEIGSAIAISDLSDESLLPNGLRARTVMSRYEFFEPVFVKGHRKRFETDVDWFSGPLGARAEFTDVRDNRERQGIGDQNLSDVRARGFYVSGAVVLTGEDKRRPVVPKRRTGALELAGRFERLTFDSVGGEDTPLRNPRAETILQSGDRVLTIGLNWYANRWVKLQLQTIREHLIDVQRSPLPDGSAFWSPVFRIQLGI